jgi:hypothetical protein
VLICSSDDVFHADVGLYVLHSLLKLLRSLHRNYDNNSNNNGGEVCKEDQLPFKPMNYFHLLNTFVKAIPGDHQPSLPQTSSPPSTVPSTAIIVDMDSGDSEGTRLALLPLPEESRSLLRPLLLRLILMIHLHPTQEVCHLVVSTTQHIHFLIISVDEEWTERILKRY